MKLEQILKYLREYKKNITIMEVCGTHTASIVKNGIRDIISPSIKLVSGPGCPVCVTSAGYTDMLVNYAFRDNHTVLSFGDMFKVRGSKLSLSDAKAAGASVRMIYSPLEATELAKSHPDSRYILAAVGFETTTPIYAVLLDELIKNKIENVKLATSLKTMPEALEAICMQEAIDAFLCPGHVSAVIGSNAYEKLCGKYKKPFVIAGFEAEHILGAVYRIIRQREKGIHKVENLYTSIVSPDGQGMAKSLMDKYFVKSTAFWRGIGEIADSGMALKKEFSRFDAGGGEAREDTVTSGCRCGDVLLGRISPKECELFAAVCTPSNPVGACMVSSEGACGIWYEAKR